MKAVLLVILFTFYTTIVAAQGSLVLIVDTSSSIDNNNLDLQFDSYAQAMDELSILSNVNIEVILFDDQPTHISSGDRAVAAAAFRDTNKIDSSYRGLTCLGLALEYVELLIPTLPQPVVIDISGDGEANCIPSSARVTDTLDRISSDGTRVNTLLVMDPEHQNFDQAIAAYRAMRRNGGFTMVVDHFYDFEDALFRKLTIEVSELLE
jgi:hypothetical protein